MKKAKFFLVATLVLGVVGGAVAFKMKSDSISIYSCDTNNTKQCKVLNTLRGFTTAGEGELQQVTTFTADGSGAITCQNADADCIKTYNLTVSQ